MSEPKRVYTTHPPNDSNRSGRYRKQFLELYYFSPESVSSFFQRLLGDNGIRSSGFDHGGQCARHAQTMRVFGSHHKHVRSFWF